ncbi:MAG: chromosome partitioning protein ParB [Rubrivivax sp.]
MKNGKRIAIGARPPADPQAEAWVRAGDGNDLAALARGEVYTARLTLDVTPALRGRIKVAAFSRGITVADMLRALLEREFPEQQP